MSKQSLRHLLCRFSVRSFLAAIAVLCMMLAYWRTARERALIDVAEHAQAENIASIESLGGGDVRSTENAMLTTKPVSQMPFVVSVKQWDADEIRKNGQLIGGRKYYLWFGGLKLRLPFEAAR